MEWKLLCKFEYYIVLLFHWVMEPVVGWWLESHYQNLHKSNHSEMVYCFSSHWSKLGPIQHKFDYVHCKKSFLFSYWTVNIQMVNQITLTQMEFLNMVCSILHTDYVHFKKALIALLQKINKREQFIHIHMGLWIWLFHFKLSRFLRQFNSSANSLIKSPL